MWYCSLMRFPRSSPSSVKKCLSLDFGAHSACISPATRKWKNVLWPVERVSRGIRVSSAKPSVQASHVHVRHHRRMAASNVQTPGRSSSSCRSWVRKGVHLATQSLAAWTASKSSRRPSLPRSAWIAAVVSPKNPKQEVHGGRRCAAVEARRCRERHRASPGSPGTGGSPWLLPATPTPSKWGKSGLSGQR